MFVVKDIQYSQISIIKNLWEKNRKYHEDISEHFGDIYSTLVFEERINSLSHFNSEHIKISIAENSCDKKILGYCISTFEETVGETHTLHVDVNERNNGIGKKLMESHINWLQNNGCTSIAITVVVENTNTIEFYKKLGFKPNTLEMRL